MLQKYYIEYGFNCKTHIKRRANIHRIIGALTNIGYLPFFIGMYVCKDF